jgi:hypothetical protein
MEKPQQYFLPCGGGPIDKIVHTAVCLLASFEAISGRDVPIAHIEPRREFFAFTHIPNLIIYDKNVYSSHLIVVWNLELAERPLPIFIQRDIREVFILTLGHELLHGPIWIFLRLYLADKLKVVALDIQAATISTDDLRARANSRRYYIDSWLLCNCPELISMWGKPRDSASRNCDRIAKRNSSTDGMFGLHMLVIAIPVREVFGPAERIDQPHLLDRRTGCLQQPRRSDDDREAPRPRDRDVEPVA